MAEKTKSYKELINLKTFEERYEYLKLNGYVGDTSTVSERYINQKFYRSREWKRIRNYIILRDNGCDLGVDDRPINGKIYIHHIVPITSSSVVNSEELIFDPDNLISVSHITHNAIHYGTFDILPKDYKERSPGDTKLW